MSSRVIMLVDLDYFFAQCEEKRNPELKTKPVVVCVYSGRTEDSGAVSTANYIARSRGVKSGMPIFLAKKRLENTEAVFLPVDHDFYEAISARIMNILRGFAEVLEQVGIDEAYLDVTTKIDGKFERAKKLAEEIKEAISEQEGITCSIGVGPNKLVAKMASDEKKPDGLTIIRFEEARDFLKTLPVNRLLGVGKKTEDRMKELGINTIGELATIDSTQLRRVFGEKLGDYFHNASLGIDNEKIHEKGEAESISRIATLKQNTREIRDIMETVKELSVDVHSGIAERQALFKSITVIAILSDLTIRTRSKTLEKPASDLDTILSSVRELFEKLLTDSDKELRRVGVKVSVFEVSKGQKTLVEYS
jgi:DNA polymerase IV (DinB-like DNA polymerase)